MGNLREFRQLTPRKGLAVVVPVRLGHSADVDRILGDPSGRHQFYVSLWPAGEPINFPNLDGPDVSLPAQPSDCLAIQSGGKMWCGYDAFVARVRELAPYLADAVFYVGDEEDYIDEFRLSGGVLEYRRVHSGYYLPVRNFLRSRGVRQTPNQALQQTGGA